MAKIPRTIEVPNPEWVGSEQYRDALEQTGYPLEDFLPEEFDKALPEDGGWILMLMEVRVGVPLPGQDVAEEIKKARRPRRRKKIRGIFDIVLDLHRTGDLEPPPEIKVKTIVVPRLSIWFALPTLTNNREMHQAIIQTPEGAVHVWPHEYKPVEIEKFLEFGPDDGFYTHFLSESSAFDEAALFYIRSRGISLADAQRMLLGSLKDPHYCYFTFDEAIKEVYPEGTGTPYLMNHNHERRRIAHAKRTPERKL